jgi:5-methylcytosine-specific restriction endonuclease McrA
MGIFRQIHTKIWKDGWFLDLPPAGKLLFVYLFSNERASVAGIYELPIKVICWETDLDESTVVQFLKEFAEQKKAWYQDSVVWVKNLRRYNATSSIKVLERIRRDLMELPECDLKAAYIEKWGIPEKPKRKAKPPAPPREPKRTGYPPGSREAQTRVRKRLLEERGAKCEICGYKQTNNDLELHHKIPVRANGTLDDDNCIILCHVCHLQAGVANRKKYPIPEIKIPYPWLANETETETEQERETETEHEQEKEQHTDTGASAPNAADAVIAMEELNMTNAQDVLGETDLTPAQLIATVAYAKGHSLGAGWVRKEVRQNRAHAPPTPPPSSLCPDCHIRPCRCEEFATKDAKDWLERHGKQAAEEFEEVPP